ncbi:hypothetical protein [Oceanobacillus saliphilus]|uniref:hypothetical protein n=1 Tax=Oceanobacillus saliphilus TaxID=2925834 RepID=UPI00201E6D7D|nr:hypothetical protein [Oceanobacillus saliphilus]
MKKRISALFLLLLITLLLVGCMSKGSAATVEGMYKAALNREADHLSKIFSQVDGYDDYYLSEIMNNLTSDVMDANGIENMNIKEIERKHLNLEAIEDFDDEFGSNWELVAVQMDVNYFYVWVLKEVSGNYFIVYAEDFDKEEFEELLK